MHKALLTRNIGFVLIVLAAVVSAFLPGVVRADHSGPTLFFTDAADVAVENLVLPVVDYGPLLLDCPGSLPLLELSLDGRSDRLLKGRR